jgi:hypothetical protein
MNGDFVSIHLISIDTQDDALSHGSVLMLRNARTGLCSAIFAVRCALLRRLKSRGFLLPRLNRVNSTRFVLRKMHAVEG